MKSRFIFKESSSHFPITMRFTGGTSGSVNSQINKLLVFAGIYLMIFIPSTQLNAQNNESSNFSVGVDMVSRYTWRGLTYEVQPLTFNHSWNTLLVKPVLRSGREVRMEWGWEVPVPKLTFIYLTHR